MEAVEHMLIAYLVDLDKLSAYAMRTMLGMGIRVSAHYDKSLLLIHH